MRLALAVALVPLFGSATAWAIEDATVGLPADFLTTPGDPGPGPDGTWFLGGGPHPGDLNLNLPTVGPGEILMIHITPTPEPATLGLLVLGGLGVLARRRRK